MRAFALLAIVPGGVAAFFLLTDSSSANTLIVGSGGYATIQAAVNAASPGDNITVKAGTYREAVDLSNKAVTVQPYGDGAVVLDEECINGRDAGFYIGGGSGQTIKGLTIKNTVGASIYIEGGASNITIDGNTLIDFDCTYDYVNGDGQYNGGVASWYGGSGITITNNLIQHRSTPHPTYGQRGITDGIWFKSSDERPSGGGHYIANNTIIGGRDGIGGEVEGSAHGSFDGNSVIENNTVSDCWDDGIQVEGGDDNVYVRNNDISGCGIGIAFAAPIAGPLYIENNHIHDLTVGVYGQLACYKVGNSSSATAYLTGNVCDVDSAAEVSQGGADGLKQTNSGMFTIVSRQNVYHTSRYVFEIGQPVNPSFDEDCLWTVDPTRFIQWGGTRLFSLAEFQAATGQELHGQQSADCGTSPTPTPTPTTTRTPTPTPTRTANPTPTPASSYTPGPLPTTAPGTPVSDASRLFYAAMAPGWNYECYVGDPRPAEEAFATAAGRVSAAYRLGVGGVFDRWFPNRPEVSTLTAVNPGDTLFVLTSDPFLWTQAASDTESTVDLAQGWNGVCYMGESGPVEEATQGLGVQYAAIYSLAPDRTWQRFVPGRAEISNLSQLAKFTPVLILVTGNYSHWVFNP